MNSCCADWRGGFFFWSNMKIDNFLRFMESIKVKDDQRVVSVTVRPIIHDCTGTIYFTDLQLQENSGVTGYVQHTSAMLRQSGDPKRHYNGIVRSDETLVIPIDGETSTALDCFLYPKETMQPGSIELSKGAGSHRATFLEAAASGDEIALLASTRECLKNGNPTAKHGFYQYTAACDSKHRVKLQEGTSARVYFEYEEMLEGEPKQ